MDKPSQRALDAAAASRLMRVARADPDPLARLIVELLARTGIRRSELLDLTVDAVLQIGSAFWLRIPVAFAVRPTSTSACRSACGWLSGRA